MTLTTSVALPQDTFAGRTVAGNTNASSWGTASNGVDTWNAIGGSGGSTTFAVASSEGTATAVSSAIVQVMLGNESWTDMGVLARMKASNAANTLDMFVRITDTTHYYRVSIIMGTGQNLTIGMKNGGSFTGLASGTPSYTPAANTFVWIRFHVVGNALFAKTWIDGNSEPAAWTVTYTDLSSTFTTGGVGMGCNTNSAGDVITVDSFSSYAIYNDSENLTDSLSNINSPSVTGSNSFGDAASNTDVPTLIDNINGYRAVILNDRPVAYYRLNDPSGLVAADETQNARNGTISSTGITLSQTGALFGDNNSAMLFNGSTGYISIPRTNLPSVNAPWSIEGWAKVTVMPGNGSHPVIVGFGNYSTKQMATIMFHGNSSTTAQTLLSCYSADVGGPNITLGSWYYVVATFDGVTAKLYTNGTLSGSESVTLNVTLNFASIGAGSTGPGDYFGGTLDEIAIYDYALSQTQITAHYSAGVAFTNETLSITNNPVLTDAGNAADALNNTDAITATGNNSMGDAASSTGIVVLIDTGSFGDTITTINWPPAYIVSSRNGTVTISSRNGTATTSSRNGSVTVSSRSA